jgi:hypothetical protein
LVERAAHEQNTNNSSRKRTSGDVELEYTKENELKDTASSPLKPVAEEGRGDGKP